MALRLSRPPRDEPDRIVTWKPERRMPLYRIISSHYKDILLQGIGINLAHLAKGLANWFPDRDRKPGTESTDWQFGSNSGEGLQRIRKGS
jgi:hypothetical protein